MARLNNCLVEISRAIRDDAQDSEQTLTSQERAHCLDHVEWMRGTLLGASLRKPQTTIRFFTKGPS